MVLTLTICASYLLSCITDDPDTSVAKVQKLNEVVVTSNLLQERNIWSPQMGTSYLNGEQIRNHPTMLGEPDLVKSLQGLPGVSGGLEGFSGLYVRGGENDENLFVFGHLPLYHITHVGGFLAAFNPWLIHSTAFYKSYCPTQYGGRLSSITDIRISDSNFNQYHGHISIGLLDGNVTFTGPLIKNQLAFTVALRRSWLEAVSVPTLAIINSRKKSDGEKTIGRYVYDDINIKLDYLPWKRAVGYTQLYLGHDYLKVGEEVSPKTAESDDKDNTKDISQLRWGNWGLNSYLYLQLGKQVKMTSNVYLTHYSSTYHQDYDEYHVAQDKQKHDFTHRRNKNGITDLGLEAYLDFKLSSWMNIKTGGDYIRHIYHPEAIYILSNNKDFESSSTPLVNVYANEASIWGMTDFNIGNQTGASIGLRTTCYHIDGKDLYAVEPRMGIRWSFSPSYSLKIGYNKMHQYAQQVTNSYINLPTDSWLPTRGKLKPAQCEQLSAGLYGSIKKGLFFSAEVYYKWMNHLLEYKEGVNAFKLHTPWEEKVTSGRGHAYGLDISFNREYRKLISSISYGLMWNRRKFKELNSGKTFPAKYDNRHKVNIIIKYMMKKNIDFDVSWTYFTGNRMTLALYNYHGTAGAGISDDIAPSGSQEASWGIGYYESRNNVRLPSYHRLDIGMHIAHTMKKGCSGKWNFGIYNLYSRMNPIAITKKAREKKGNGIMWESKFKSLSIFPIIPSVSYTYSF